MRVLASYDGSECDVHKFYQDHRKVLREAKVIFDIISIKSDIHRKELKRLLVPTFQATGFEGEMMIVKITAAGLYTSQRIGSLPIPHSHQTLHDLRKFIEKIIFIKVNPEQPINLTCRH